MTKTTITKLALLSATAAVGIVAFADPALAQDLGALGKKLGEETTFIPKFVSWGSYVAGIIFSVVGVARLKAHTENPGNMALGKALAPVGAGGAFLALPTIADAVQGTFQDTGSSVGVDNSGWASGSGM